MWLNHLVQNLNERVAHSWAFFNLTQIDEVVGSACVSRVAGCAK